MDVKRMHFFGWVHDAPVLQRTDIHRQHWTGVHFEFLAIMLEALFVFSEIDTNCGSLASTRLRSVGEKVTWTEVYRRQDGFADLIALPE